MPNQDEQKIAALYLRTMTVAQMRLHDEADFDEVMFCESARFYRLLKANPAYAEILGKLRQAMAAGTPITIGLASIENEIILTAQ